MNNKKNTNLNLKISAKRLHAGRKFMYNEIEKTHKKYLSKSGEYKQRFLESRNCPLCLKSLKNYLFQKRGGHYVRCNNCGLVHLDPVFKDKELNTYYKNLHNAQSKVVKNENDFYRRIYSRGLELIHIFKRKGSILDVGCSSGFFLDIAKEKKWQTFGIELNKKESKIAKKKHSVFEHNLELLKNKKFDVITMWDVIEHIKDGNKCLQEMKKKLNKNGLVFFQTPNINSLAARVMQSKCNVFDGIEHVNLYDFNTMKLLAHRNNFKILKFESVISEIPVVSNYLDYQDPYTGNMMFTKDILGVINEKNLHKNLLGYKMQVVLKKLDN
tara:strand:- start:564 stop:1544 length:981 start_codon:yes stop_codon:yes gene_type:complete